MEMLCVFKVGKVKISINLKNVINMEISIWSDLPSKNKKQRRIRDKRYPSFSLFQAVFFTGLEFKTLSSLPLLVQQILLANPHAYDDQNDTNYLVCISPPCGF